ncbi:MAG TPA: damage-control phosphatase ARMT1 family protein [Coleofasciculaceae cyanobacterium]
MLWADSYTVESNSTVTTGKPVVEQENLTGSQFRQPCIPIPPPLMMSEEGSFAYFTLIQRMPAIVQRVIDENDFPSSIVENLETLIHQLPDGTVRMLNDKGPDVADWDKYLEPFLENRWIDIPWLFAEVYFYRRIIEATHYFLPGSFQGVDPYEYQKRRGLKTAIDSIVELSARVNVWSTTQQHGDGTSRTGLIALLYFALWGNRADLSLWPINPGESEETRQEIHLEQSHILADDTALIADTVAKFDGVRIDLIADNAGFELVCDLCLADFLLASKAAEKLYLHLKPHPTFVSDATIKDVHDTLEFLAAQDNGDIQSLAHRLQDYIAQGRLVCREDFFWTAPLMFWEMPEDLKRELAQSGLILSKGDANYRRCLGDRHWSFTTSFQDIVCYFPAPFTALRTLKSELAAGLQPQQVEALNREDSQWLTNGQWGVIQFVDSRDHTVSQPQ